VRPIRGASNTHHQRWKYKKYKYKYELIEFLPSPSNVSTVLAELTKLTIFPSKSQAKRSFKFGRVIILDRHHSTSFNDYDDDYDDDDDNTAMRCIMEGLDPWTVLNPTQHVSIVTRSKDKYHSPSVTGFMAPPRVVLVDGSSTVVVVVLPPEVVYEDEDIALLNKPEILTTIGESRNDLKPFLPFLLEPSPKDPSYLPRPVHRLDRRTSGLVLVAKTKAATKRWSQAFAKRNIQKTYVAIVIGQVPEKINGEYNVIDIPIDGKTAVSHWRVI
jgi:23S rRNA-/tRNA-specific pseudouridylate synthase